MVSRAALIPTGLFVSLLVAASPATSQTTSREIAEVADFSGLTASPDGKWVAYRIERPSTATNRIDLDWYIVATDGMSPPRPLGRLGVATWDDAGVVVPGEARWSPDSKSLVVRGLVDDRIALFRSDTLGSGFRLAAGGDGDIEAFAFLPTGDLITSEGPSRDLIARTEEEERERGILLDGTTDLAKPLFRGAMINGRAASQRFSNDWFDRAPLLAAAPRKIRVRLGFDEDREASDAERGLLAPAPHPALLMLSDLPAPLRAALKKQNICPTKTGCPVDQWRLSWWLPQSDGRHIVAVHNADYAQRLERWSPERAALLPLARSAGQLSGGRYYFRPCAAGTGAIYCVEAAADVPPRLVRLDAGGKTKIVDTPNSFPDSDGLLAETIAWQVGGSRASGILIRPKIPGRLPLFVTYYQCAGYLRGGVGNEWPLRALAAHGIAALCINAIPSKETGEPRYVEGLAAIEAVVALLDRKGQIDRSRVGMGGLSFGSEVTTWTATHSNLLKAFSIASVQMEPAYYWFNARPGRETFADNVRKTWGLGSPDEDPEGWKRFSFAGNVDKVRAPALLQLPEQEARLSIEALSKLTTARLGEVHIFPYAPHNKVEPRQKLAAYERNLDWFRFWLKGEIDSDPGKVAQYQRWSKLEPRDGDASTARTQRSTSAISINRK